MPVERPHGIVLVTGPTGSGKTTTLYSTLKRLATPDVNVCTVEDPIEMIAPEFNQMQVQANIDLDFASGVRTLLRQDPDIIMIGEIRDLETAQMAVQASLTGHLVLSTLHTNDAPSAVTRLLDLGVPHYLLASTLNGILAQRLVRTLCPHCKQPHPLLLPTGRCSLIARLHIQMPPRPVVRSVAWSAGAPDSSAASACMSCCHWARGCAGRSAPTWIWPVSPAPRALKGCEPCARPGLKRWRRG